MAATVELSALSRLARPFSADEVEWRVGVTTKTKDKGMALAYIDARDVMARLDDIMGPLWQCRYQELRSGAVKSEDASPSIIVCEIGLHIDGQWIWRSDGAGDTDVESEKGALSDAFKRAAVRWGIGRFLYAMPSPWVQIEPAGRSFKIKDSERPRLRGLAEQALKSYSANPSARAQALVVSVLPEETPLAQEAPRMVPPSHPLGTPQGPVSAALQKQQHAEKWLDAVADALSTSPPVDKCPSTRDITTAPSLADATRMVSEARTSGWLSGAEIDAAWVERALLHIADAVANKNRSAIEFAASMAVRVRPQGDADKRLREAFKKAKAEVAA